MQNFMTGDVDCQQLTIGSGTSVQLMLLNGIPRRSPLVKGVYIKGHPSNSGIVYVGNTSSVTTTTGVPVGKSELILWPTCYADQVWAIADGSGQKVGVWCA